VLALADGVTETVEWVDLDEVVLTEIEAVRTRAVVEVELTPFSTARLRGRSGELSRVVRNLLDNAERHARRRATVGLWTAERFAELVVADDGLGIPESDRTKVFERFFRTQRALERDSGGVGSGAGDRARDDRAARRSGVAGRLGGGRVLPRAAAAGSGSGLIFTIL